MFASDRRCHKRNDSDGIMELEVARAEEDHKIFAQMKIMTCSELIISVLPIT